jgi:hypothetical protein
MHLKECVATTYFQLPVKRKQEKRREFFRIFTMVQVTPLRLGAFERRVISGRRVRKFSVLTQKLFFGKHLKTVTEPAPICGANCSNGRPFFRGIYFY